MKLEDAVNLFLKLERSPQSTRQYRYILYLMVIALGPKRKVSRITSDELIEYFHELRVGKKPLTISGYIGICKSFFSWCVKVGHVSTSPADTLQQRQAHRTERNRAIPAHELQRMVEYASLSSPRNYAILLFLADTACRVGGLGSLTLDGLEIDRGRAFLIEKGQIDVTVFFTIETQNALTAWLKLRPQVRHRFVWTGLGPTYEPLSTQGLADVVRRIARKTGASEAWGPHSIRHGVGHAYERAGVSAAVTQRKLNHARVETTLRSYYPDGASQVEEVSQRLPLSGLVKPPAPKEIDTQPGLRLLPRKTSGAS